MTPWECPCFHGVMVYFAVKRTAATPEPDRRCLRCLDRWRLVVRTITPHEIHIHFVFTPSGFFGLITGHRSEKIGWSRQRKFSRIKIIFLTGEKRWRTSRNRRSRQHQHRRFGCSQDPVLATFCFGCIWIKKQHDNAGAPLSIRKKRLARHGNERSSTKKKWDVRKTCTKSRSAYSADCIAPE